MGEGSQDGGTVENCAKQLNPLQVVVPYGGSGVPIYSHPSLAGSLRMSRSPDGKELPAMSSYTPARKRARKQYRLNNPEKWRKDRRSAVIRWRKKNRCALLAHNAVANALRRGKIRRPKNCSYCGEKCKPNGHHPDYRKPLEVVWLCTPCHNKEHDR